MADETPDDLVVRVGNVADLDDVLELAFLVAGENGVVPFSREKILKGIWPALNKDHGMIGIVGPKDGKPQGFVLLRIQPPWYGDTYIIEECGIYVHPDYRQAKGGRATLLYKFCREVADKTGYRLLVGVLSRHRTASKVRYYERFFGPQAGAFYIYDPPGAAHAPMLAAE